MIRRTFLLVIIFTIQISYSQIKDISSVKNLKDGVELTSGNDKIVFKFCEKNILSINFLSNGKSDKNIITEQVEDLSEEIDIKNDLDSIILSLDQIKVFISKKVFSFSVSKNNNTILNSDMNVFTPEKITLNIKGKNFYGISNREEGDLYLTGGDTVFSGQQGHAGAPFFWTTEGYGLLFDEDGGEIKIKDGVMRFLKSKNKKLNSLVYILFGSPKEIITELTELTGKPPLFPKWSLGFLNSEWGIDQKELFKHIKTYRDKDIPIDAFILDFDWMDWGGDNYGEFRFGSKFPDGKNGRLKEKLDAEGIKLLGIRKPRIHLGTMQGNYAESNKFFTGYENDYFSKKKVGLLDFYKPEVRKWYWDCLIKKGNCINNGLSGYWNDEADAYGGNFMFTYMQKAQYEGQRSYNNSRVFSLNRNFYCGNQKYAYGLWSGDIDTGFKVMAKQVLCMLTSVNLGASWWSMDIGGFKANPTDEAYYRWMQFGSFVPIFRVHGALGHQRQPWYYSQLSETIARKYIRLRYQLIPYLYSYAWENHNTGVSIVRPLIFEYPDDERVFNNSTQFFLGEYILVSPILTDDKKANVSVYLPEGVWYDFWTDKMYPGGQVLNIPSTQVDIPVFIKAGAIIPSIRAGKYVDDPSITDEIMINYYPGPESAFTLYEDDGNTYDYEKGKYSLTKIRTTGSQHHCEIEISESQGNYVPRYNDIIIKIFNIQYDPAKITLNNKLLNELAEFGLKGSIGWKYDSENKSIFIRIPFKGAKKSIYILY